MDMTLSEFEYLTSTCWKEKYQPVTIDFTEDKYTVRYQLGLNSLFVTKSFPFYIDNYHHIKGKNHLEFDITIRKADDNNFNFINEFLFKCNRTRLE